MRGVLRWLVRIVLALVLIVAALVAYVYVASARLMARTYVVDVPQVPIPTDAASIARGKYLAEHVAVCVECHGADFGGKVVEESFPMGRLVAANLTRGRGGLDASYSDRDFVRVLTHGVKRDGHSVIFMPVADYKFSAEDLGAIISYVKSMPPVDRQLPSTSFGPMARALGLFVDFPLAAASQIDHAQPRLATAPTSTDPVSTGAYLVSSAGCKACHGATFVGGGGPPPGASNITPVGIGDWTASAFLTAIREHKRPNGSTINEAMPRAYGQMSDADLQAIFAYLKTVPPAGEKRPNQK
jgi:mono/diheme cytochrome c family protein